MKQSAKSLAEHLKGFSAVSVDAVTAAAALEKSLLRYGPVQRDSFGTFQDALKYLLPIKSFTTRFLVLGLGKWTILVTDMRGENCYVQAYSISRATGCNAIGLHTQQERRELHVFENGQKLRQVQSLHDGDRWYYLERGALQPFEDVEECQRRKKKDRLGVEALHRYFTSYTGLMMPDWKHTQFHRVLGMERSRKESRMPLVRFETIEDL